jgi:hypothetical protein
MSKNDYLLTLCRLQTCTLYNPIFCLDNGERLNLQFLDFGQTAKYGIHHNL